MQPPPHHPDCESATPKCCKPLRHTSVLACRTGMQLMRWKKENLAAGKASPAGPPTPPGVRHTAVVVEPATPLGEFLAEAQVGVIVPAVSCTV